MPKRAISGCVILLVAFALHAARKPGQKLKPGFNLFSKQQDIQLGEANAKQVLEQYPVVQDQWLQDYVRRIGKRLAAADDAKSSGFQFTFTVLNQGEVNAFALPGGPMFIFSGLMKASDNEAQLAGVMGHEMAHVILRHGTHQATRANMLQIPALLAGAVIGSDSTIGQLANMGLGLGANSFILKFSRDAETEADAMGSALSAEAGYNPIETARFFQKLNTGQQPPQFFSDHPNPGNREKAIQAEIQTFPRQSYGYETGDFARMKQAVNALPAPPAKSRSGAAAAGQPSASGEWQSHAGQTFSVSYPGNWSVYGDSGSASVTIAPREGLATQRGSTQIGLGAILSYYVPESRGADLRTATGDLIRHLKAGNPRIAVSSSARSTRVAGANALVTTLSNSSPFGGGEVDALVTVMRPQGLFYLIFIAPEQNFSAWQDTFQKVVDSLRFSQ